MHGGHLTRVHLGHRGRDAKRALDHDSGISGRSGGETPAGANIDIPAAKDMPSEAEPQTAGERSKEKGEGTRIRVFSFSFLPTPFSAVRKT
jgi:hypothetical protein